MTTKKLLVLSAVAVLAGGGLTAGLALASAPTGQSLTSAGTSLATPPACALPLASIDRLSRKNFALPDTAADYWAIEFKVRAGLRITLSGQYPDSRYFSVQVYDSQTMPFTENGVSSSLSDYQIEPDPGSINPWQHQAPPGGTYTVTIRSDVSPGEVNTLPLAPAGTPDGTSERIYLRIYLAQQSPAQVPLPTVTTTLDGVSTRVTACPASTQRAYAEQQERSSPLTAAAVAEVQALLKNHSGILPFVRLPSAPGGGFDANDAYLGSYFNAPRNGDVLIIHGKAATTPAGSQPSPWPAPGIDMQYWSLCDAVLVPADGLVVNPLPDGQTDYGCRHDSQVQVDRQGYYTFVIGAESQRAAIERIPGATFLPLSSASPTGTYILILRNTVIAPGFTHATEDIPADNSPLSAATAMGQYYPRMAFCSLTTLARRGPMACLLTRPMLG
jgi:hypothetical protein